MIAAVVRDRHLFRLSAIAVIAVSLAGCTSPTSPTVRVAFQQIELRAGTGTEAAAGMTLMVNYTGWLYDDTKSDKKGTQFDANPVGFPFIFRLGTGQVIGGWDLGLVGLKVGGMRRLIVPSELAYGRDGAGNQIPPNATLVFDVELLGVVSP